MYLWTPPVLNLEIFHLQKISWWSDKPTLMTPFWESLKGKLAKIWLIRVEVLRVTRVGYWISCFKPCIVQNRWYFLALANANFPQTMLFSWTIYLLFSDIFMLKYISFVYVSLKGKFLFIILLRKLIWEGDL